MVYDNSPALGWIRITDGVATFNNKIYIIPNDSTEKKYIYWDAEKPDRYIFSNTFLEESLSMFLVLINDNGQHTIIKSDKPNFNIKFDTNIGSKVNARLNGLYEDIKKNAESGETKYSNIVQDLEKITQTVGKVQESNNSVNEVVSRIQQNSEEIKLEVRNNITEFNNAKVKEIILDNFIEQMSDTGALEMHIQKFPTDNSWDNDSLNVEKEILQTLTNKLIQDIDNMKVSLTENILNSQDLKNRYPNLEIYCNTIIQEQSTFKNDIKRLVDDFKSKPNITANSKKVLYDELVSYISDLSRQKNSLLQAMTISSGGKVVDLISKLFLNSSEGGFSFSEKFNGFTTKLSDLKVNIDGINSTVQNNYLNLNGELEQVVTRVSQLSNEIKSKVSSSEYSSTIQQLNNKISSKIESSQFGSLLEQNVNSFKVTFRDATGGYSNGLPNVEMNSNGLTVNKGYIATDCLTVPRYHYPVIKLFNPDGGNGFSDSSAQPSIDATYQYMTGWGNSIRLKWDNSNYYKIGTNLAEVYLSNYGSSPILKIDSDSVRYKGSGLGYAVYENGGYSIIFDGVGKLRIKDNGDLCFESTNQGYYSSTSWNYS